MFLVGSFGTSRNQEPLIFLVKDLDMNYAFNIQVKSSMYNPRGSFHPWPGQSGWVRSRLL